MRYQPTIVLNQLKTLSYGGNMRATRLAQRDGADEALLIEPDGTVLEAPTSTLFWVDTQGNLHTPELDTGVLASITRERIMRLVPVTEDANCSVSDVLGARASCSSRRRCARCRASRRSTGSSSTARAR